MAEITGGRQRVHTTDKRDKRGCTEKISVRVLTMSSFLSESVFSKNSKVWKELEICIDIRRRSVTIREILQKKQKYQVR